MAGQLNIKHYKENDKLLNNTTKIEMNQEKENHVNEPNSTKYLLGIGHVLYTKCLILFQIMLCAKELCVETEFYKWVETRGLLCHFILIRSLCS